MQFSVTNFSNPWERLVLSEVPNISTSITARQGAGMCQLSPNEIMIVGGFNGKFLSDYYVIRLNEENGKPVALQKQENVIFGDPSNKHEMSKGASLFPF